MDTGSNPNTIDGIRKESGHRLQTWQLRPRPRRGPSPRIGPAQTAARRNQPSDMLRSDGSECTHRETAKERPTDKGGHRKWATSATEQPARRSHRPDTESFTRPTAIALGTCQSRTTAASNANAGAAHTSRTAVGVTPLVRLDAPQAIEEDARRYDDGRPGCAVGATTPQSQSAGSCDRATPAIELAIAICITVNGIGRRSRPSAASARTAPVYREARRRPSRPKTKRTRAREIEKSNTYRRVGLFSGLLKRESGAPDELKSGPAPSRSASPSSARLNRRI